VLRPVPPRPRGLVPALARLLAEPNLRLILGAVLLVMCLLWMDHNDMFSTEKLAELLDDLVQRVAGSQEASSGGIAALPLTLPGMPSQVANVLGSFNAGLAGLILIFTSIGRGWKFGLCAIVSAGVALLGHLVPLPVFEPFTPEGQSMALGMVLMSLSFFLLRYRRRRSPTP
jgi:hypothetical protein